MRVLGCYPKEPSTRTQDSLDLPDPIASDSAGAPDLLHSSDDLIIALSSALGRSPEQARLFRLCTLRLTVQSVTKWSKQSHG